MKIQKVLSDWNHSVENFQSNLAKEFPDILDTDFVALKHLVEALELERYYLEGIIQLRPEKYSSQYITPTLAGDLCEGQRP